MYKYILRRLLLAVPVLVLSSLIVFSLMRVMPGDALTALMGESGNVSAKDLKKLRGDLGLDLPTISSTSSGSARWSPSTRDTPSSPTSRSRWRSRRPFPSPSSWQCSR